ncbi:stage II sporulation protein M [Lederbergia graminis]|uniref:Stage II sporulation protein M n=1 Tax=Lederbergia graminis TaxID=735518 RepID=A0ABW0LEM9_9BACI|nr:stage II sporulation protein M [Paenibacillus bovis]HLU23794.1 stage II sporulation protein M [Bacillaceae bacterium]
MRKRLSSNLITRHLQEHSSIYLFLMVLFLMGIIFGAIMVNSLSDHQKEDLFYYLNQFFGQVEEGAMVSSQDLLKLSFLHNLKFAGLIWILGVSIIGLPLIFVLLFIKGIVVGFSVGFFVNQMGWQGLLLAFGSLLPQNLFIIPAFIFVAACSVSLSIKLIRKIFIRQTFSFQLVPVFSRYVLAYIATILVITIAASIEAYLTPALMKAIIAGF